MRKYIKGFSIQLCINLLLHVIRLLIAYLIIEYAPEPEYPTSFSKDSGWQIISLLSIITYNIISLIVAFFKYRKRDIKKFVGFGIASILGIIFVVEFCGL